MKTQLVLTIIRKSHRIEGHRCLQPNLLYLDCVDAGSQEGAEGVQLAFESSSSVGRRRNANAMLSNQLII